MPNVSYTLFSPDGTDVVGLMAIPPRARDADARPGWICYVAVADVDACAA